MNQLRPLLESANPMQLESLRKILGITYWKGSVVDEIIHEIRWRHRNLFEHYWRDLFNKHESYKHILRDICDKLRIDHAPFQSVRDLETLISQKVMKSVWEKLNEEQRQELKEELDKIARRQGKKAEWIKAGGLSGAIIAAELGGFTSYLLATSGLAALVGAIGVTLPFAVYTALTSTMAVILGPIGWIGAAVFALWKITGTNYKRLIPAVLYITTLRYELTACVAEPTVSAKTHQEVHK